VRISNRIAVINGRVYTHGDLMRLLRIMSVAIPDITDVQRDALVSVLIAETDVDLAEEEAS